MKINCTEQTDSIDKDPRVLVHVEETTHPFAEKALGTKSVHTTENIQTVYFSASVKENISSLLRKETKEKESIIMKRTRISEQYNFYHSYKTIQLVSQSPAKL